MPKEKYKMEDIEYAVEKCISSMDAAFVRSYAYDHMLAVQLDRTRPAEMIDEFMRKYGPESNNG